MGRASTKNWCRNSLIAEGARRVFGKLNNSLGSSSSSSPSSSNRNSSVSSFISNNKVALGGALAVGAGVTLAAVAASKQKDRRG